MKLELGVQCRLEDPVADFVGFIIAIEDGKDGNIYTFSTPHGSTAQLSEDKANKMFFPLTSSEVIYLEELMKDYLNFKQQKRLRSLSVH